jgi:hypothetical protein
VSKLNNFQIVKIANIHVQESVELLKKSELKKFDVYQWCRKIVLDYIFGNELSIRHEKLSIISILYSSDALLDFKLNAKRGKNVEYLKALEK